MKKVLIMFLLVFNLSGLLLVGFSDERPVITWIDLNDYQYYGTWNDVLIFRSKIEYNIRFYNKAGKMLLELDACYSFSTFDDFIAVARMVQSDDYEYYNDLFFFGKTEEIREDALKHLGITYKYDYYDKNLKKYTPTNAVVKYLEDGYGSGTVGGVNISGNYAEASHFKIFNNNYYVIYLLEMIDQRKVGLGDSKGNVLIEPAYSKIESYYDSLNDKIYLIMYDSIIDEYGEKRHYIVEVLDESLKVIFNVPSRIGGLEPYINSSGLIILREDSKTIRAFTLEGEEVLKDIKKSSFYEKDGWFYIKENLHGNFVDYYRLNVTTAEIERPSQVSFPSNVGVVQTAFNYFYYKRLDGGEPDIKFSGLNVGYYFENDAPRICAFSDIEGNLTDFLYDANYGSMGKKTYIWKYHSG